MLSILDALYPPFSPDNTGEGFSYETINSTARNYIWVDSAAGAHTVPIVITEMRMGELTMINVTGAIAKIDIANKKGKTGAIWIDYEFPYSFIGMSGKNLTVCVPTLYNWNNEKQGGSAQIRFDGTTRKIEIWPNEPEAYEGKASGFKIGDNALEAAMCGIQSFTLWANTSVVPSTNGGANLGAHVGQKEKKDLPEAQSFTFAYVGENDPSTAFECEIPCYLDDDGNKVPKYITPDGRLYNLPEDFTGVAMKLPDEVTGGAVVYAQLFPYDDSVLGEYIFKCAGNMLKENGELKCAYHCYKVGSNEWYVVCLSRDKTSTNLADWRLIYKEQLFNVTSIVPDSSNFSLHFMYEGENLHLSDTLSVIFTIP